MIAPLPQIGTHFLFHGKAEADMMIGGVCGARVSIVNAIAAVPRRVQQALLDFPRINFRALSRSSAGDPKCSIAATFVSGNITI